MAWPSAVYYSEISSRACRDTCTYLSLLGLRRGLFAAAVDRNIPYGCTFMYPNEEFLLEVASE